jgi:multifunctional 2-oxoglutarate metabolism enzyme
MDGGPHPQGRPVRLTPMPDEPQAATSFGPNAWLVDDMYDQYRRDPSSVSESWQEFFADYHQGGPVRPAANGATNGAAAPAPAESETAPAREERPTPPTVAAPAAASVEAKPAASTPPAPPAPDRSAGVADKLAPSGPAAVAAGP